MARPKTISDDEVLQIACKVFLAHGFGAPTPEIARQAGISEALLFKRFGTKEALFRAAMGLTEVPVWVKEMDDLVGRGDVQENLNKLSLDIIGFLRTVLPRLMMLWSARKKPPQRRPGTPAVARNLRALAAFFEREMALGRIRPGDPEATARVLFGALFHYVFLGIIGIQVSEPIEAKTYTRNLVDFLWAGLAPVANAGPAGFLRARSG